MKTLIISIKILFFFTILTGILYPLFITGIAQALFPHKANGSIIIKDGKKIGSELIAQKSDTSIYFSSRPSAIDYGLPSGASNFGLTNTKLKDTVNYRSKHFISINQLDSLTQVPSEMVFASGSGLDPDISPKAALLQVNRIAGARHFSDLQKQQLIQLIQSKTEAPQFGLLGDTRINVLLLNIELDKIK
jgi:K+-transporting ATPase ATPase C chain